MSFPFSLPSNTSLTAIVLIYGLLGLASLVYLFQKQKGGGSDELAARLGSWWVIITLMIVPLMLGALPFLLVMSFISFVALKEFLSITPGRMEDRPIVVAAYLTIPLQAFFIWLHAYGIFLILVPVYAFLVLAYLMTTYGKVERFLPSIGIFHWALMTTVYNLGYVSYIMFLPEGCNGTAGNAAIVLFLLIATQLNDVAQYVWGKSFGKRKILPSVSPNKTWEGFIGGWATAGLFIAIVGPMMTPMQFPESLLFAALMPLVGFIGDVTMSAIKRDLGVKDTSSLIPGHGGALDRLDSLTFTAPIFFHLLIFTSYGPFAMSCS